jgi:hypothetical protein
VISIMHDRLSSVWVVLATVRRVVATTAREGRPVSSVTRLLLYAPSHAHMAFSADRRVAEFFDDRVHEANRCQKCERPRRASLSLSNGARNISGELKEHFAMAQFVFWAATIGGCAAWTAIGYALARLI